MRRIGLGSATFGFGSLRSLPQKSPSSIIDRRGPLSNPTPAVQPWRREPRNLPHFGRPLLRTGTPTTPPNGLRTTTEEREVVPGADDYGPLSAGERAATSLSCSMARGWICKSTAERG